MPDNTTILNATGGTDTVRDIDRSGVKTQVNQTDIGGSAGEYLWARGQKTMANTPGVNIASDQSTIPVATPSAFIDGTLANTTSVVKLAIPNGTQSVGVEAGGTWNGAGAIYFSHDDITYFIDSNTTFDNLSKSKSTAAGGYKFAQVQLGVLFSGTANIHLYASSGLPKDGLIIKGGTVNLGSSISISTNASDVLATNTFSAPGTMYAQGAGIASWLLTVSGTNTGLSVTVNGTKDGGTTLSSLPTGANNGPPTLAPITAPGVYRVYGVAGYDLQGVVGAIASGSVTLRFSGSVGAHDYTPFKVGAANAAASSPVSIATESASGTITTQNLVPTGAATAGSAVEITLNGAATLTTQVTGTYTGAQSLQVTRDGSTWVTKGGNVFLNDNTGGFLSTITSALQSCFQSDVAGYVKARVTALAAVTGTATISLGTSLAPAFVAVDTPLVAGAAALGSVTLGAGTNLIGDMAQGVRTTANGLTTQRIATAATTNGTQVKASAGRVYKIVLFNLSAATKFIKFSNVASGLTVGTTTVTQTIPLAVGANNLDFPAGLSFATGIALGITGAVADTDTTATAANDVVGFLLYA